MSVPGEIRWQQRFSHFEKAYHQLVRFLEQESLNEMEQQGLIKSFDCTYELAWNTLKDYLLSTGLQDIYGPRDAVKAAFKAELIEDGHLWMEMIKDRNLTVHTYNEDQAKEILSRIVSLYAPAFKRLYQRFVNRVES